MPYPQGEEKKIIIIVGNVGRAEKKARGLGWRPGRYQCAQGGGQERSCGRGARNQKETKK